MRREVDAGTYGITIKADVRSLPNPRRFIDVGEATFTHDMKGFRLDGDFDGMEYNLTIPAKARYSIHIEYDYRKWHRDCIDLSTLTDTMFVFPQGEDFSVTKMSLACEEIYKKLNNE